MNRDDDIIIVDLIIKDVWVEGIEGSVDLAINNGLIHSIGSNLPMNGRQIIEGNGQLASPPFIDPHTHLDKAFLQPKQNSSGTLDEAIKIIGSTSPSTLMGDLEARADKALHLALSNGTQAIRTHIDIDSGIKVESLIQLLKVKQRWDGIIDIQIVAFPQQGLLRDPDALTYMRQSLELGASVVGGIPAIESSDKAARKHIDLVFDMAQSFDCDIDMHIDENLDPNSRTLEILAETTIRAGWVGRVTAAHCSALSVYDEKYARHVIDLVREADINVITNPGSNLVLLGREGLNSTHRGVTRVKELLAAGVNVSCGQDNLRDVFYPFGQADMLEIAFLTALSAQLTGTYEIEAALNFPRLNGSKILGINNYGLHVGNPADIVLLPVNSSTEALASRPIRKFVFRRGKILYQSNLEIQKQYTLEK